MSRFVLGVDPGLSGAFALLTAGGEFVAVWDAPRNVDDAADLVDSVLVRVISEARGDVYTRGDVTAVLERAFVMSGQHAGDYLTLDGAVQGSLATHGIRRVFVSAATWKKALGLPTAPRVPKGTEKKEAGRLKSQYKRAAKDHSRELARRLFPDAELPLQKHDGRAEALLIAYWGVKHG